MGLNIYQTKDFIEQINDAKKRGGIAADAAKKAEQIIKSLSIEMANDPTVLFRYIGQQEHRIKNCRKVYLQGGYRMVFIQRDNCMICCFFGEHDECFRWVEANKRNKIFNKLDFVYEDYSKTLGNPLNDSLKERDSESIDAEDMDDDDIWDYELPPEKWEEEYYLQTYEQQIIQHINTPDGQRIIEGWFR